MSRYEVWKAGNALLLDIIAVAGFVNGIADCKNAPILDVIAVADDFNGINRIYCWLYIYS